MVMKSMNFKITARFTIKTSKQNAKIHYESAEVRHIA